MTVGMEFPDTATHELRNVTTHEVSLVDLPANKRPFLVVKSATGETDVRAGLVTAAKKLAALLSDEDVAATDAQALGAELLELAGVTLAVPETEDTQKAYPGARPTDVAGAPDPAQVTEEEALKAVETAQEVLRSIQGEPEVEKATPVDEVESILEEATKATLPDAFDIVLLEAQVEELRLELEQSAIDHGIAKAEQEAKVVFLEAEYKQQLEDATKAVEEANSAVEKGALLLSAGKKTLESKDSEIADLTKKLEESADALSKAKKLTKAAPQARQALSTLTHLAKGTKAANASQVLPEGESQQSGDPWEGGWEFE